MILIVHFDESTLSFTFHRVLLALDSRQDSESDAMFLKLQQSITGFARSADALALAASTLLSNRYHPIIFSKFSGHALTFSRPLF
jgi:hypothetical protein